jgi:hypothetical protein
MERSEGLSEEKTAHAESQGDEERTQKSRRIALRAHSSRAAKNSLRINATGRTWRPVAQERTKARDRECDQRVAANDPTTVWS